MPSQARKDSAKRLNNAKKPEGSVNTPNNKIQTTTQKKSPSTGRNFNDERGSGESKYEFWGRFQ
jgi:hypothetical protein